MMASSLTVITYKIIISGGTGKKVHCDLRFCVKLEALQVSTLIKSLFKTKTKRIFLGRRQRTKKNNKYSNLNVIQSYKLTC